MKDFYKNLNIWILSGFDLISEWNALDTIGEKVAKLLARENTVSTEPVQALLLSGYPRHMSDVSAFMQKACNTLFYCISRTDTLVTIKQFNRWEELTV